ncbi:ATP-binding protein [Paraflavitalea soli]|uniref:ATP-binding protein n=1 Tax=Paraflavitalea soli TaxID=2315862 RepID=A0A3B7MIM8_9BACT|nr:ATP-binding protein [Paraflavitalea soli]AXY73437.1 ATP-binding protein [Paraflavitalea soli]
MKWSLETLQSYISDGIEENLVLEYKAGDALQKNDKKKGDIAKDVSAMANSAGGTIIYGIREFQTKGKEHLPEIIDAVKREEISKEWLEQVINSNIQPKIENVLIIPIPVNAESVVYVVEVPQSDTAHQASDFRYYKRHNFVCVAMEDYEIRDIMSRLKHPKVELEFLIERIIVQEKDSISGRIKPNGSSYLDYNLKFAIRNLGKIYAKYVNYSIELPQEILENGEEYKESLERRRFRVFYGDNTYRDIIDIKISAAGEPYNSYGPSRYDPILPGTTSRSEVIRLKRNLRNESYNIYWKVFADNAEPGIGEIAISKLLSNATDVW